jgi:hypothetical protein
MSMNIKKEGATNRKKKCLMKKVGFLLPWNKFAPVKRMDFQPRFQYRLMRFKDIHTIKQLFDMIKRLKRNDHLLLSPTGCFFNDENSHTSQFYCDSQGCVNWFLKNDGFVYAGEIIVAHSLPEFLTRLYIENKLWTYFNMGENVKLSPTEIEYIGKSVACFF